MTAKLKPCSKLKAEALATPAIFSNSGGKAWLTEAVFPVFVFSLMNKGYY